jgi:N6-adenosine-specific RNA methylase IME4
MTVTNLRISDVVVPTGRRQLRGVEDLAASIAEVGLLNPITVTSDFRLVAGYHRLTACQSLGWTEVPAVLLSLNEVDAELAELDENMFRANLTVLEWAECLKRRKELYEAKHPESRRGSRPGKAGGGKVAKTESISSFAADSAAKSGVSGRTVQQGVQIAEKLHPEVKRTIRDLPLADSKVELLRLARMTPETQRRVADAVVGGKAKGVLEAARKLERAAQADAIRRYVPPDGRFPVIVADPPWPYESRTEDVTHLGTVPYPTMSMEEIRALRIPADENAVLWLWTTNAFMRQAYDVLDAWGFQEKTILTWVKPRPGIGNWLRGQTEHCILAIKGRPVVQLSSQGTVLVAPIREHSRKPDEFYELVEGLCPARVRLDMFARESRPGWTSAGAEATKFVAPTDHDTRSRTANGLVGP